MIRLILIISIFILYLPSSAGAEAQICGYAPGAAGEYIGIYSKADPVTGFSSMIERVKVEDNEYFNIRVDCSGICWFRLRYGIYDLLVLVEEGGSYKATLPVFRGLKVGEKLNPFFKYRLSHLRLEGNSNINNRIRHIDSLYFNYTGRLTSAIYRGEQSRSMDSLMASFEHFREDHWSVYSRRYFDCRHSLLRMVSERRTTPLDEDIRLMNDKFLPDMPAYSDLVSQVFNGYLRRLSDSGNGDAIHACINSAAPYRDIIAVMTPDGLLSNESLLEYVLLENLYNEYYRDYFRKEAIEKIFAEMAESASDEYNRELAVRITEKINRLKPGNKPPGFSLENKEGEIYTLDSLRGKHTILVFGSATLPDTGAELDILDSWAGEYEKQLSVVVILLDEDFESSLEKLGEKKYDFIFLDGYDSDSLHEIYGLKYLPAFYFLDRNMRLIASPAPFPSEDLRGMVISRL